jgi:hypothetical protein
MPSARAFVTIIDVTDPLALVVSGVVRDEEGDVTLIDLTVPVSWGTREDDVRSKVREAVTEEYDVTDVRVV